MPDGAVKWDDLVRSVRMVVFDFDGTLVDSNPIKRRAFESCFAEFPSQLEEIVAYCTGHHHAPRGEKFCYVYEQILQRPYTPEVAAALHARFESSTTQQIIAAPEIRGAERFVRAVRRTHETALLSSTPHAVLLAILERRGWRADFGEVRGAPVDKAAWLRRAWDTRGIPARTVLFIGDTDEDAQAAAAAGCAFLGVGADPALGRFGPVVADFSEAVA